MKGLLPVALLLALPAMAEVRMGFEFQSYPLLPSFYQPANKRFVGLSAAYPASPRLHLQGALSRSLPAFDGPYNDVSEYHGFTFLVRAGAEYQIFHGGPVRLFLGAGLLRMTSSWRADDQGWEDPPGPREFWSGDFSHWALEGAPRLEFFRENQAVDWSISLALPCYLAFATELENAGKALEQRFRENYMNDAEMGFRLVIGLGFGP